jgi:hypothetical protein
MRKYPLGLALIGLSAVLTGCGSQADCTSSDVQETYLGMVGNLNDEDAADILKSSVFKSVVTRDMDKDTGYRSCAATIVMKSEAGSRERNISYQIEQVESGDTNFKVYADRADLGQVSYMATALAKESRANKKTKELIDAAAANPYVLANEQDAREAGIAVGHRFFGDRVDESLVRVTPLDIDGDGVVEFLTAMKINYASGDSTWYAFASHQYPKGSGKKNAVEFAGEGAIEALGMEPSSYEMQEKSLIVTMVDGSKKSLAYHASTDAYRAYIQANGGNPSAPITPSAMSVPAAPGTAPTTAPTLGAAPSAGVIDAAIAAQAKQEGGGEYAGGRKSIEGDINGDGTPDVTVLYSLEGAGGGNGSVSFLAAFLREAGQLKLADTVSVSGLGISVQSMRLEGDGAVRLTLLEQGPEDSSVQEEAVYMLNENRWMLIPEQS